MQADRPLRRRRHPETCAVEGCRRGSHSQGLCGTHYKRTLKHGDARADHPVRVASGEGWISHGYLNVMVPQELRHLTGGEAYTGQHRLVMAQHLGRPLHPDETVHHINGARSDNRLENLELWSSRHPQGQRVTDKVRFAVELLQRYRPDLLADGTARAEQE